VVVVVVATGSAIRQKVLAAAAAAAGISVRLFFLIRAVRLGSLWALGGLGVVVVVPLRVEQAVPAGYLR